MPPTPMAVPKRAQVRSWLEETAHKVATSARKALAARDPGRTVRMGASGSPTSRMDEVAEQALVRELRHAPIKLNLISEELGILHQGGEWWLVADPVDGSRNALHGIPHYAVSLAIGRRDLSDVELGLVQSIPGPDAYWAEKGRGATLGGKRLRPRKHDPHEILVGTALDYSRGLRLPTGAPVHFRDLGSAALEMCYVAQGLLDAFYVPQPLLRVIDVAASTLIVREAGGRVFDLGKRPLNASYDLRTRFPMVALGDARAWGALR